MAPGIHLTKIVYSAVCAVYVILMLTWKEKNQRTNGPVTAHLSLLHIPINMFEYYGI